MSKAVYCYVTVASVPVRLAISVALCMLHLTWPVWSGLQSVCVSQWPVCHWGWLSAWPCASRTCRKPRVTVASEAGYQCDPVYVVHAIARVSQWPVVSVASWTRASRICRSPRVTVASEAGYHRGPVYVVHAVARVSPWSVWLAISVASWPRASRTCRRPPVTVAGERRPPSDQHRASPQQVAVRPARRRQDGGRPAICQRSVSRRRRHDERRRDVAGRRAPVTRQGVAARRRQSVTAEVPRVAEAGPTGRRQVHGGDEQWDAAQLRWVGASSWQHAAFFCSLSLVFILRRVCVHSEEGVWWDGGGFLECFSFRIFFRQILYAYLKKWFGCCRQGSYREPSLECSWISLRTLPVLDCSILSLKKKKKIEICLH